MLSITFAEVYGGLELALRRDYHGNHGGRLRARPSVPRRLSRYVIILMDVSVRRGLLKALRSVAPSRHGRPWLENEIIWSRRESMITGKRLAALLVVTSMLFGIGCENRGGGEQGAAYERGRLGEEETQSAPGMGQTDQPGTTGSIDQDEDTGFGTPGSGPSSPGSEQPSGAQSPGSPTNP